MNEESSPSGKLIVGHDGAITTITLNRPQVHNALDQEISAELNAAVKDVAVDRDCRVLILRGAGDTFCAGDDIKGFLDFAPDDGPWNIRMYQETVNIIDNLVPVTIAGVDGVCAGGGLELTLVCDFVIATHRSRWGMPEINWGITPGWGGTGRLSKFAGRRKTKEWNLIHATNAANSSRTSGKTKRGALDTGGGPADGFSALEDQSQSQSGREDRSPQVLQLVDMGMGCGESNFVVK